MHPLVSKGLVLLSGLATAGGVSYVGYELFRNKTIKDELSRDQKKPLEVTQEEATEEDLKGAWYKLTEKYLLISSSDSNNEKISGLDLEQTNSDDSKKKDNIKKLKQKCKIILQKTFKDRDDKDYKDALNWCSEESPKLSSS